VSNQESNVRALQVAHEVQPDLPPNDTSSAALILNGDGMQRALSFAEVMASGKATIPAHLRGNKGDCLAITMQAMRWGMDPFAVASKTHVSQSGALGYEGQLINAVIISNAPIKGRPKLEYLGDWDKVLGKVEERKSDKGGKYYAATYTKKDEEGLGVIYRATFIGEDEPSEVTVMMSQAYPRFSTQWATDPKQQIAYLAGRKWARLHAPDVILGVYTPEEQEEAAPPQRNMGRADIVEPPPQPSADLYKTAHKAAEKGAAVYQEFWAGTGKENRKLLAGDHEDFKRIAAEADAARTVDNPPTSQPATQSNDAAPTVTFAEVMSSMRSAAERRDLDALNAAADMIRSVTNEDERNELSGEYRAFVESIEGAAQ
jgi:RecT family.